MKHILFLLLCGACGQLPTAPGAPAPEFPCNGIDDDGDGVVDPDDLDRDGIGTCDPDRFDCNDLDASIGPHRSERCNGVDDDCDGVPAPAELDRDFDGQADCANDCDDASGRRNTWDDDNDGWTSCGGDCDDLSPDVHPYAEELCNNRDDDCDGTRSVNEQDLDGDGWSWCDGDCSPSNPHSAPVDFDGDGFQGCAAIPDCDDTRADANPDATEHCNGLDDNCNGVVDDGADNPLPWFMDEDGDGYGGAEVWACAAPSGATSVSGDCDDHDPLIHPAMPERCDERDQNCNGVMDEHAPHATGWRDLDNDGFGDDARPVMACVLPPGTAQFKGDCDDTQPLVRPGARDLCNGVDDDCDGRTDEDPSSGPRWYRDNDDDGHGDALYSVTACERPEGYSSQPDDCDDTRSERRPGQDERCNGIDDDCDSEIDEGGIDGAGWFFDVDGDGWGGAPSKACYAAPGLVPRRRDCDDHASGVHPGATEHCDGVDEDCDHKVDDGAVGQILWHPDDDLDGFGDFREGKLACVRPPHHVEDGSDCDDDLPKIHPGGTEVCNGRDDDCDGEVDEDALDAEVWWVDGDLDGYGLDSLPTLAACRQPEGYASQPGDCHDGRPRIHPGAPEVCDHLDNDCSGTVDDVTDPPSWFQDHDQDGFGDPQIKVERCFQPGSSSNDDDCDDQSVDIHPGQDERCDGLDNDCDRSTDEDPIDPLLWYPDTDRDGYGAQIDPTPACTAPPHEPHVTVSGDCDDMDGLTYPTAPELCDGRDNDCDNNTIEDVHGAERRTWYRDPDRDGYGDISATIRRCWRPTGYAPLGGDCNETEPEINPGVDELCTRQIDENCDGDTTLDAVDAEFWYGDRDHDGAGDQGTSTASCVGVAGAVRVLDGKFDCDDQDPGRSPYNPELCTIDVDENCDDSTDADAIDAPTWYADNDHDGYGGAFELRQCTAPTNYFPTATDCRDNDPDVHPGAAELCDGLDNDCDGLTNEDTAYMSRWWLDSDGDGLAGNTFFLDACDGPPGSLLNPGPDCDDLDAFTYPGATEDCGDVDRNCDGDPIFGAVGDVAYYFDEDGDGFGDRDATTSLLLCGSEPGYVANQEDCNDEDSDINPSGHEVCDHLDQDCDEEIDEYLTWEAWPDQDGDRYGDMWHDPVQICPHELAGWALNHTDCDDGHSEVYPDSSSCIPGLDTNCDTIPNREGPAGVEVWCPSTCGDGVCDPAELATSEPDCLDQLAIDLISTCGLLHKGTCSAPGEDWPDSPGAEPEMLLNRGDCVDLTGPVQPDGTCPALLSPEGEIAETWRICFPDLRPTQDPCAGDPTCRVVDGCDGTYVITAECP